MAMMNLRNNFTLLHVQHKLADTDTMFQQALDVLKDHNIDKSRVHFKVVKSSKVASTIEKEAQSGMFSVIAVGYTGRGNRGFLTIGSVATKLCYEVTDSALWIG